MAASEKKITGEGGAIIDKVFQGGKVGGGSIY